AGEQRNAAIALEGHPAIGELRRQRVFEPFWLNLFDRARHGFGGGEVVFVVAVDHDVVVKTELFADVGEGRAELVEVGRVKGGRITAHRDAEDGVRVDLGSAESERVGAELVGPVLNGG